MGAPVCHADDEQRQEQKHEVGEEDEEAGRWAGYSNGDPIGNGNASNSTVIITNTTSGNQAQGAAAGSKTAGDVVTPPSSTTSRKTSISHPSVPRTLSGSTTTTTESVQPVQPNSAGHNAIGRGMACTFCRKRKLKCSGERPQCSSCRRYNKGGCEYTTLTHHPRAPADPGDIIPEPPIFTSEPLLHTYVNQQTPFDFESFSRRPSVYDSGLGTPSDPASLSGLGNRSASISSAAGIGYDTSLYPQFHPGGETTGHCRVETAWYQAALDMPPPPLQPQAQPQYHQQMQPDQSQAQSLDYGTYPPYDSADMYPVNVSGTVNGETGQSSYFPPTPIHNDQLQQQHQQAWTSPPGTFTPPYSMGPGMYTTPVHDGYQPGMVHEGIYHQTPHSQSDHNTTPAPATATATATMFDQSQSYHAQAPPPHTMPSDHSQPLQQMYHQQQQHTLDPQGQAQMLQSPLDQQVLQSPLNIPGAYTVAHESTRPNNLRSISLPSRQMNTATPETTTTTRSDLSSHGNTNTATTVSVSIPEEDTHASKMHVYYNSNTPPESIDRLSDRLGEFLLGPSPTTNTSALPVAVPAAPHGASGRRASIDPPTGRKRKGRDDPAQHPGAGPVAALAVSGFENDGLTDSARNQLLEVFFSHHKIFLDLSIPRFKYRLAHSDRRRPGLALLNAMYMWATRMGHAPNMASMEKHFYEASIRHLDASAATGDRLMDCIRAAFLLSAFQYMNGRHHSGYLLCGHAANLVKSCGLHKITSTVFSPAPPTNPFLRHRPYLLPPPEDALELGERIHTFWAVFSLDRSSSALTGFSSSFRDGDVTTPWPRELADIASGSVTQRDDVTVRDLYRLSYQHPNERSYLRWVKAVVILERASKLVFFDPEEQSEHTRAWQQYRSPSSHPDRPPPGYLEQPRYRVPTAYADTKLALEMLIRSCGDDGVFPVDKTGAGAANGEVVIAPTIILFHHICAATETLLHDTNSLDSENVEALVAARKSVALIRELPPLPVHAVDAFAPLVWVMIAKILIKEVHRLRVLGDPRHTVVEAEAQCLIDEIDRVGVMMPTCRMYARGVEQLLNRDRAAYRSPSSNTGPIPVSSI